MSFVGPPALPQGGRRAASSTSGSQSQRQGGRRRRTDDCPGGSPRGAVVRHPERRKDPFGDLRDDEHRHNRHDRDRLVILDHGGGGAVCGHQHTEPDHVANERGEPPEQSRDGQARNHHPAVVDVEPEGDHANPEERRQHRAVLDILQTRHPDPKHRDL